MRFKGKLSSKPEGGRRMKIFHDGDMRVPLHRGLSATDYQTKSPDETITAELVVVLLRSLSISKLP